jgi:ribosome-binding factor A
VSKTSRNIRVNELLRQELSLLLHTRYRGEASYITLTEVDISPDHRNARVYFSVVGDEARQASSSAWLRKHGRELQYLLARRITLKHTPRLRFEQDVSVVRGNRILQILNEIGVDLNEAPKPPAAD